MIKNPLSMLRYTAVVMLVGSLFALSSCSDDDKGPSVYSGTSLEYIKTADFKQSATVTDEQGLDSLVKYLSLYPDLAASISGTSEFTLFAPSNKAFKNLLATPGFPSNIALISPDIIKGVLSYHLVSGKKVTGTDIKAGASFNTLYTDAATNTVQVITVNSDGTTLKTGSTNTAIHITTADKLTANGVIQVVESVMIPPTVGASLTPILGTMAGTVLLGKDFTLLARLIARADAGYTEDAANGKLKISSHLARPTSTSFNGATFFAPPNAVFEAAATAAGITSTALIDSFSTGADGTARAVILNHYIFGKYVVTATSGSTTLTNGMTLTNLLTGKNITVVTGATVSAQNPYGVVISNTPTVQTSFRPIVSKDLGLSNGIIQVFGGILQ